MQEDKNLKALLTKYAMENPPANFTSGVMQRIIAANAFTQQPSPLFKQKLLHALLSAFILVCIALFILCFTAPLNTFIPELTIKLPATYFSQSIQFFAAFWIVMLLNLAVKKYAARAV